MEPFLHLDAVALPIPRSNVDTDQIVPARYLQKPRSDDFGQFLFRDLRFDKQGREISGFILNQPPYRQARVVVAQSNFGCGSSREHAVWALHDYGFRAVIAPSFGDIFFSNALKNGLLPIVLPAEATAMLLEKAQAVPGMRVVIDLPSQIVTAADGSIHAFQIDAFSKKCLIEGLNEIDYTLQNADHITAFEQRHATNI
ncbi:3-isopropylmalate dehydratase small subunit [Paralcaligenes ginsengisoli]|jgi:3-isopropylmalate/(R)-2-methylmalate dehydratase small subunit